MLEQSFRWIRAEVSRGLRRDLEGLQQRFRGFGLGAKPFYRSRSGEKILKNINQFYYAVGLAKLEN